ncbi:MAG: hypothetical protein IT337_07840, partial [Thermomicrobiales bacterium]|nr:hypothetical protein [Thermomicrobiales bacterium]
EPIGALVLTHQRGTFAPADATGRPLGDYIVWMDRRGAPICDRLERELGIDYYDRLLHPIQPYTGFSKMIWLEERGHAAPRYLPAQSVHIARLTGAAPACDPSTASFLGPWRPDAAVWDEAMCIQFGMPPERLPTVLPSTTIVGELGDEVARELRLPKGLPVVLGAADGQCAALGAGCTRPGLVMINVGTATGVQAFCATPQRHPTRALNTAPHALPGAFEMEGHTQAAGAAIDWLRALLGNPTPEELVRMAQAAPPGADGVVILPTFNGVSAPVAIPRAAASIHGLHLRHGPAHLARAMLEAICYEARWILGSLESAVGPTDAVVLVGGFARSPRAGQMMADILGVPVQRAETDDAALTGAARLGRMALGLESDDLVRMHDAFEPNPELKEVYDETFARFISAIARERGDETA